VGGGQQLDELLAGMVAVEARGVELKVEWEHLRHLGGADR
jgi:hypothetical protein